ncbi:PAS domain S-box-containing protein/diguanylate cyclase (GGDEF) domain-containing protein [Ancylobacter rudongensis]|uniref:PAS domain S-box-containing protein/diguanylate cyclase (GGDEF) domain-containing protein n=2 Tax=Ancylobacter rudongensis TaxID=177413 RepID=A0A1G4TVL2_9HYPH|nr:PAS domain S-box-containing protein/diguanylate cyclase (GGDEF) domain-containing protein [Ancylobacter rudongensis]
MLIACPVPSRGTPRLPSRRPAVARAFAVVAALLLAMLALGMPGAQALEAVAIRLDAPVVDLAPAIERRTSDTDRIQVSTVPGADGIVRRIEVRSVATGPDGSKWAVFALANNTDEQVDRLIVAPHYRMVGSGVFWPDLGNRRILNVTTSQGFRPELQNAPDADVFFLTLDPGTTVTLVAELGDGGLPQLYLWEPEAYKDKVNSFTLYNGIVIGIAGLLALFLTILFVVKGSAMFPAAAALAWAVLGYIGLDFGFWSKVFGISPLAQQFWRAAGEAILAATLVVFLFAYLNLNRWHVRYAHITAGWLVFLAAIVGLALLDPSAAAGIARPSLLVVSFMGFGVVVWLALHRYDRAVLIIPTLFLLVVWVITAGMAVSGRIGNDLVAPALLGGLVLIVMLIGFTVMQHAFAGIGSVAGSAQELERRALAVAGSGDIVWDWDVDTDRIHVSPEAEHMLGLKQGTLETEAAGWLDIIHPGDRDRFRATLDGLLDQRRGRIDQDFRLRAHDGHYLWFNLRARPVVGTDGEVVRCIGTLSDVTDSRTAEERMLHDAVHDNLTGLPNRELFLDRVSGAAGLARSDDQIRPTVMLIDLDRFKQVNASLGMPAGDSILLTVARRLMRLVKQQDTLARLGSDHFALILLSERDPERITAFADTLRRTLRAPITFGDREIFITASIGLLLADGQKRTPMETLKDAELAMYFAKRVGGDRIEVFRPNMRTQKLDRLTMEQDLRQALQRGEISVLYQPIVDLATRRIAGFESVMRWQHPTLGTMAADDFLGLAEETGLIVDLGLFVLDTAARQLGVWQRTLRGEPIFVSVNISSRQMLRHDMLQDLKAVLARNVVAPGTLKLELSESLAMENPEYTAQILLRMRELDAGLTLEDFGSGYSALAYLQRFPFDSIKVDRTFTKALGRSGNKAQRPVILRTIVNMAQDLGMDIIAEGVESEQVAAALGKLGCRYGQGRFFGEALTTDEARKRLQPEQPPTSLLERGRQLSRGARAGAGSATTPLAAARPASAAEAAQHVEAKQRAAQPAVATAAPQAPARPAASPSVTPASAPTTQA